MRTLKKQSIVALFLFWLLPSQTFADSNARKRTPDRVLVVFNADSPVSKAIADDYVSRREVRNVLPVKCRDSALSRDKETIAEADYKLRLEGPIRDYLAAHPKIDFIVLTKGIPIRMMRANNGGRPSVDSCLAALDYTKLPNARKINIRGSGATGWAYLNRYWKANAPFSHAKYGGYLVTRLDGYTEADAKALVQPGADRGTRFGGGWKNLARCSADLRTRRQGRSAAAPCGSGYRPGIALERIQCGHAKGPRYSGRAAAYRMKWT